MSRMIRHCKICLNPDSRPKVVFDEEGICLACQLARINLETKIDWKARRQELDELAAWGRANSKCSYDCIIGVSGGKDSTRQAFYIRDELGLKPLLVSSVYPPEQLVDRGARNLSNLVGHGFDCISLSLDPQTWKKTMREAFRKHANQCKSSELPLYAIPVHIAVGYQIPLIFLGENPAYYLGTPVGDAHGGDASRMKYCNTLEGGSPEEYLVDGVTWKDLYFYAYPSDADMQKANVRIAYLGYYVEDFNSFENLRFALAHGLELRTDPIEDIGDYTRSQSLDEDFYPLNQFLKHLKFGIGQVADKVSEEIRHGRMDKQSGIELIRKYDGKCAQRFIRQFCEYIEITEDEFWLIAERARNKEIWKKDGSGQWRINSELLGYQHSESRSPIASKKS